MTEVLSAPRNGIPNFSTRPLRRSSSHNLISLDSTTDYFQSPPSKSSFNPDDYGVEFSSSAPSSAPSSPQLRHPAFSVQTSYTSTPTSSLSLDTKGDLEDEEEMSFPSYDVSRSFGQAEDRSKPEPAVSESRPRAINHERQGSQDLRCVANDDQAIEKEPTRHVDYLSHEWKEEDIWSSWRYIVSRRNVYSNSVRLENASWRTWAKAKDNLKTVSPETLNWLKDCDVTWLYGPLQNEVKKPFTNTQSFPPSQLSKSSSFLDKKPILKKKSHSEAILQRSISSHSLLKHAGAILQAQEAGPVKGRPSFGRAASDFTIHSYDRGSVANTPSTNEDSYSSASLRPSITSSGLQSPGEKRHIHFNNEVVQCIAVDSKGDEEDEEHHNAASDDDTDDEDGVVMMKQVAPKTKVSNASTPRGSFSNDGKTIAPLPSTTLKYRRDTPEPNEAQQAIGPSAFWPMGKKLSPSPSQETLRPPNPHANFLIDDDEEDPDVQWQPSPRPYNTQPFQALPHQSLNSSDDDYDPGPGMRRTESGMFMPYDEDEDEAAMNAGLFGRVIDTVNTARDIAHVIWNVGWRR